MLSHPDLPDLPDRGAYRTGREPVAKEEEKETSFAAPGTGLQLHGSGSVQPGGIAHTPSSVLFVSLPRSPQTESVRRILTHGGEPAACEPHPAGLGLLQFRSGQEMEVEVLRGEWGCHTTVRHFFFCIFALVLVLFLFRRGIYT